MSDYSDAQVGSAGEDGRAGAPLGKGPRSASPSKSGAESAGDPRESVVLGAASQRGVPWQTIEFEVYLERSSKLITLLLALEVTTCEEGAAMRYGDVRASLERRGRQIGPLDTLIGSHAHALDVILVTHSTREFSRIEGRRLEDWTVT